MPNNGNYSPYDVECARNAINYIHRHHRERISPQDLAEEVGINKKKLQLLVQLLTGYTVHEYHLNTKIENAKSELADFSKLIQRIAKQQGFHSATHFNREFKKRTNMTPKQYRCELMVTNCFYKEVSLMKTY